MHPNVSIGLEEFQEDFISQIDEEDGFNSEQELVLRLIYTEIFQKSYHVSKENLIVCGEVGSGKSRLINGVSKLF